ncbi:hypothetical protein GcC1_168001 [Golovinomyces cichoracearum]|uniref:Transcriptional regulator n=1 Tax=Golovinomyces cichoracearum TaxID=62708 RepID=A0A420HRY6_9PEZI|nr:hypothetical protein GcC1_168001 [Golovinomyces cichoracearum]
MNVNLTSPEIKAKLRQVTTDEFYGANRDDLTVRLVRDEVERVLGLEKSFLRSKDWNSKSKDIIKARVQELLELEEEGQDHQSDSTNGDERISEVQASFGEGHKNIQQQTNNLTDQDPQSKNNCTTERDRENEHDAERTSLKSSAESSEESEEVSRRCRLEYQESASKRRRLVKRGPNHKSSTLNSNDKKKEQQILDNEDCTGNLQNISSSSMTVTHSSDKSTRKLTTKSGTTKLLDNSLNLPDMTREINGTEPIKAKKVSNLVTSQGKEITEGYGELLPDQEEACISDTSIVYDETPSKTKRKKIDEDTVVNKKKLKRSQQQRQEARKNKDPSMLSSDELTIKNLQSQLRKCGNRKNWSSELKEYGSDTKAKIRHLKRALEAMGMKGRFSEAKARSIKEARELMADVEAVQEGEKKWGLRQENEKSKMTNSTMRKREEEEESDEEEKDNNNKYAHDKNAKPVAKQENDYLSDELSLDYRNTKQRDVNGNNMARKSSTRSKSTADSVRLSNRKRPSNALDWLQDEEDSDE